VEGRVYAYDGGKNALVVFGPAGEVLPQVASPSSPILAGLPHFAATLDGFVVWDLDRTSRTEERQELRLLLIAGTDTTVLIAERPVMSRTVRDPVCEVGIRLQVQGAPRQNWHSHGHRVVVNMNAPYAIEVFDSGTRVMSIRRHLEPERITEAMALDAYEERLPLGPLAGNCGTTARTLVEQLGYAEFRQIVVSVAVRPDGGIWARRGANGREGEGALQMIDVFDPEGTYVGSLAETFPFPMAFLDNDRFIFAATDSVDVQRLVVGEIQAP
jgi:hypothetical protein